VQASSPDQFDLEFLQASGQIRLSSSNKMSSDEYVSRLSAKLLQGWCMLDISCDKCSIPLMRNKQRQDYCVGCEKFISNEPHQSPTPSQPPQAVQPTPAVQPHSEGREEGSKKSSNSPQATEVVYNTQIDLALRLLEARDLQERRALLEVLLLTKQFLE
jgi:uncharacterized Zn finger protein (UPF0148 family)